MPVKCQGGGKARYRVTRGKVRIALCGSDVVEAKNLKTGATHTPAEFAADRKAGRKGKRKKPR